MNAEISPLRNGSHKLLPGLDQLPDDFFENIPRDSHPRKIFDDDPPYKQKSPQKNGNVQEVQITNNDLKIIISSQLKSYLDSAKNDIISSFNLMLRQNQEESSTNTKEIQALKGEIIGQQTKFEHIQHNIRDIGKKFSEINKNCIQEIDNLKQLADGQRVSGGFNSSSGIDSKQITNLKQEVLRDVNKYLNKDSSENILPEMKALKSRFDGQLKTSFDQLNDRIKSVEEQVREISRHKFKTFESIKKDLSEQISNTQNDIAEENASIKQKFEKFLRTQQTQHPVGSNMEMPSIDKLIQAEAMVEETNKKLAALSARISEQMTSLEVSTLKKVNLIQYDIQNLKESAITQRNSASSGQGVLSEEVQDLTNSVNYLKSFTTSCQEQISTIKNQINSLRGERTLTLENENYLHQLEKRVEELKKLLNMQSFKPAQSNPIPIYESKPETPNINEIYNSPTTNPVSNIYQHKNPFNDSSASGDIVRKNNTIAYTAQSSEPNYHGSDRKSRSHDFLSGLSSLKQPLEFDYSYNEYPRSNFVYSRDKEPTTGVGIKTGAETGIGTVPTKDSKTGTVLGPSTSINGISSESKPYYGDPKVKALIDELTKGRKGNTSFKTDINEKGSLTYQPINPIRDSDFSFQSKDPIGTFKTSQPHDNNFKASLPRDSSDLKQFGSNGKSISENYAIPVSRNEFKPLHTNPFSTISNRPVENIPQVQTGTVDVLDASPVESRQVEEYHFGSGAIQTSTLKQNLKSEPGPKKTGFDEFHDVEILDEPKEELKTNQKEANEMIRPMINTSGSFSSHPDQFQDALSHFSGGEHDDFITQLEDTNKNQSHDDKKRYENNFKGVNLSPKTQNSQKGSINDSKTSSQNKSSKKKERTKQQNFQLILSQIDYFLHGRVSSLLEDNEDEEIYCNLDENGFVLDEDGDYVTDQHGKRVQLKPEDVEKFKNENLIE